MRRSKRVVKSSAGFAPAEILKDVDYVAALGTEALPDGLLAKMREHGMAPRDLEGIVRSVTYRAVRR